MKAPYKNKGTTIRPLPDDWATWAPRETVNVLRKRYKTGEALIKKWAIATGINPKPVESRRKYPPTNFTELATDRSDEETAKIIGCSRELVSRWRTSLGIPRVGPYRPPAGTVVPRPSAPTRQKPRPIAHHTASPLPQRDDSLPGRAAEHLRRHGFIPVCRERTINSRAPDNAWRVGTVKMTTDEMVARAVAKGLVA